MSELARLEEAINLLKTRVELLREQLREEEAKLVSHQRHLRRAQAATMDNHITNTHDKQT